MWDRWRVTEKSAGEHPGQDEQRFADNMRQLRESKSWSQGELARRMQEIGWSSFHQTTVSRIEKCERPLRLGEARAIASILAVGLHRFFEHPEDVRESTLLGDARRDVTRFFGAIVQARGGLITALGSLEDAISSAVQVSEPAAELRNLIELARKDLRLTPERAVLQARAEVELDARGEAYVDSLVDEYGSVAAAEEAAMDELMAELHDAEGGDDG